MIMVYGFTQATCTCFKEAALLFTVHLSSFVIFILCLTDKYMLKVTNSANSFQVTVVAIYTAKKTNSEKAIHFLTLISCSLSKVLHIIHM